MLSWPCAVARCSPDLSLPGSHLSPNRRCTGTGSYLRCQAQACQESEVERRSVRCTPSEQTSQERGAVWPPCYHHDPLTDVTLPSAPAAPWPLQLYRKVARLPTSGTLCSDEGNDAIR